MRTNIVLEDKLVEKARRLTGLKTKRAVVEEGLRTLIRLREQEKVRRLFGKLHWEGNLKAQRKERISRDHR
jgi:Arc/MetJ family transcription regulator